MTCPACDQAAQAGRSGGLYQMACQACCVRLVLSTWPSRERAAAMLAVIERCGVVSRERVLAEVRAQLSSRPAPPGVSPPRKPGTGRARPGADR